MRGKHVLYAVMGVTKFTTLFRNALRRRTLLAGAECECLVLRGPANDLLAGGLSIVQIAGVFRVCFFSAAQFAGSSGLNHECNKSDFL